MINISEVGKTPQNNIYKEGSFTNKPTKEIKLDLKPLCLVSQDTIDLNYIREPHNWPDSQANLCLRHLFVVKYVSSQSVKGSLDSNHNSCWG